MKIAVYELKVGKTITKSEEVTLEEGKYSLLYPLKSINKIYAVVEATSYDDFTEVTLKVKAKVNLVCSYSLEEFEYMIKDSINLEFALYKEDAVEDAILVEGQEIDFDSYIFDLISMNVPTKPVKPGASRPKVNGKEIKTDEDPVEVTSSPFDVLADLDFDEEEK